MDERILSEEGYEVVTVSNADSASTAWTMWTRVTVADVVMPGEPVTKFASTSRRVRATGMCA